MLARSVLLKGFKSAAVAQYGAKNDVHLADLLPLKLKSDTFFCKSISEHHLHTGEMLDVQTETFIWTVLFNKTQEETHFLPFL